MAIIAILMGLVGFGITLLQRSARDTVRMNKVKEIETILNGRIASGLPFGDLYNLGGNTSTVANGGYNFYVYFDEFDFLQRGEKTWSFLTQTSSTSTNYCYGNINTHLPGHGSQLYTIGVQLETGGWFTRTNTTGLGCNDGGM